MGRGKRIASLVVRVVFILGCFLMTYLYNAFTAYGGAQVNLTDEAHLAQITAETKNGASAEVRLEGGRYVIEVAQSGAAYDDVRLVIPLGANAYDTSYMERMLGDDAADYEEYLSALKSGPWSGKFFYMMTGESLFVTDKDAMFTMQTSNGFSTTDGIYSSAANEKRVSTEVDFAVGEETTVYLIMGSASGGALPSGKYYFTLSQTMYLPSDSGIEDFSKEVESKMAWRVLGEALQAVTLADFFAVPSLLTFYGMMCLFCLIFYLWMDLSSALKIAGKVLSSGKTEKVIIKTYVNGVYQGSREEMRGGGSLFAAIMVFLLSMMLFVLTVPVRTVVIIVNDIYHLIRGDEDAEGNPIWGNIVGSIGLYFGYLALVGLMAGWNILIVIVGAAIGIPLMIWASKLTQKSEEAN